MGTGNRIDDKTREAIKKGLAANRSVASLAKKYGVSSPTIYRINSDRLAGVERPPVKPPIDPQAEAALVAEYAENHVSVANLAKKYGVSEKAVERLAKKAKVKRNGTRSVDSPVVMALGDWVYGPDMVARWDKTATPNPDNYQESTS